MKNKHSFRSTGVARKHRAHKPAPSLILLCKFPQFKWRKRAVSTVKSNIGVDLSRSNRRSLKKPADTKLSYSSEEIPYSARACKWAPGSLERCCHTALKP